ncbi:mitochondrial carrier [Sparassis crispa]|uniref:Mitochondrial carrier n=1 Tax=Sparassis crispa TaxID=139825 RepID=A0A401GPQ1_9APHY|nr:mitochondrial carrier [Sparassis crispa]GBE84129.1 mitochondrial carrier [Sparassis crispa]
MASSLPPLLQACSGSLASASANVISYPLDLIATKLQISESPHLRGLKGARRILRHIVGTEGFAGFYSGLPTDTASTLVSGFLYYYFYTILHALAARLRSSSPLSRALTARTRPVLLPLPVELAVGYIAGIASRAVSMPLSLITVRLQSAGGEGEDEDGDDGKRKGVPPVVDIVRSIYTEQGLCGFWAGFAPTLPLALTPALTLLFFQLFSRIQSGRIPAYMRAFLDGALSNALALAVLYPLVLAKVRVQAWRDMSMFAVWREAFRSAGWAGLYHGLTAILLKGFVSQGITMLVKQRIEQAVMHIHAKRS